jgi:hypothetical protein
MSEQGRRFHPSELDLEFDHVSAELLATARDLESYAATGTTAPTVGFEDRVMDAIAAEPMPRPSGRGFLPTIRDAWAIAFGPGRPMVLRAQAFAMLLALAVAVGSAGSVAVVGAMRLLGPDGTLPPTLPSPSPSVPPSPSPSLPPSPSPTPTPSPTARPTATESAEPSGTDDNGGGGGPGSNDDSSGPGPGGTDDHSGSGSASEEDSSGSGSGWDDSSGRGSGGSGGSGGGSGDSSGKGSGTGSGSDDASESTDD